jgi:hypothetical protein
MRRRIVTLAAGIALLAAGAFALTAWVTREPPPSEAPASPAGSAPPQADGAAPDEGAGFAAVEPSPPAAPPTTRAPRPAGDRGRVELTSASRRHGLVAFRRELKSAIGELRERVAPCPVAGASFALDVETVEGAIRVLDARLEAGAADEAGIACARAALVGAELAAPAAEPGRRWQLSFVSPAR